MSLDHGVLNIPLSKRGNFHKELDEHLQAESRRKARQHADATFLHGEARKEALRQFELIDPALLGLHADKRSMKPAALKSIVRDLCLDRPTAALKVLKLFIKAA